MILLMSDILVVWKASSAFSNACSGKHTHQPSVVAGVQGWLKDAGLEGSGVGDCVICHPVGWTAGSKGYAHPGWRGGGGGGWDVGARRLTAMSVGFWGGGG